MQWFYCYGYDHSVNLEGCYRVHLAKQWYACQLLLVHFFIKIGKGVRGEEHLILDLFSLHFSIGFRKGKTAVRFIGIYSIYREVCYKCISKFHCGWYSSSQRWEKPYLCNQRVQLSLKSSCTKILDGSSRKQQWRISGNDETQWNVCHYYQRRPETWGGREKVISKRKEIICLSWVS